MTQLLTGDSQMAFAPWSNGILFMKDYYRVNILTPNSELCYSFIIPGCRWRQME